MSCSLGIRRTKWDERPLWKLVAKQNQKSSSFGREFVQNWAGGLVDLYCLYMWFEEPCKNEVDFSKLAKLQIPTHGGYMCPRWPGIFE